MIIPGFLIFLWCKYAYGFNSKVWPPLYEAWTKKWVCRSCGNIFEVESKVVNQAKDVADQAS